MKCCHEEILRDISEIYYGIHLHIGYNSISVALGGLLCLQMLLAEQAGVALENRMIKVDAHMGAEAEGVFAAALQAATRF